MNALLNMLSMVFFLIVTFCVVRVSSAGLLASAFLSRDAATKHSILLVSLLCCLASPFATAIFESTNAFVAHIPLTTLLSKVESSKTLDTNNLSVARPPSIVLDSRAPKSALSQAQTTEFEASTLSPDAKQGISIFQTAFVVWLRTVTNTPMHWQIVGSRFEPSTNSVGVMDASCWMGL